MSTVFYLATCLNCTPVLPMPFYVEAERDAWVEGHGTATGHLIRFDEETRN